MAEKLILEDVVKICHCSERYVREQIKLGHLKAYKMGRRLIFDPADVEKWIKRKQAS